MTPLKMEYTRTVVLKSWSALEPPGGLVKTQNAGSTPGFLVSQVCMKPENLWVWGHTKHCLTRIQGEEVKLSGGRAYNQMLGRLSVT